MARMAAWSGADLLVLSNKGHQRRGVETGSNLSFTAIYIHEKPGLMSGFFVSAVYWHAERLLRWAQCITEQRMRATWDIFCSVVDNYGDIGVTWRLARQLVA